MFTPDQYSLMDFGQGRRLERFGEFILDRPCPAAEAFQADDPSAWLKANARFELTGGGTEVWSHHRTQHNHPLPNSWSIAHNGVHLELKPTLFGHIGVFPEQAANWDWIERVVKASGRTLNVLNLFAYTGGSTLSALRAGARVTHVDAARNIVAWARRNAEANRLAEAPARWIVDDVMKFVARELRRRVQYDAMILDPPSYGHGPRGEVWRLEQDLPRLLEMCAELTHASRQFMLLSCHTPGFSPRRLRSMVNEAFGSIDLGRGEALDLALVSCDRRLLPCGSAVRWQ